MKIKINVIYLKITKYGTIRSIPNDLLCPIAKKVN